MQLPMPAAVVPAADGCVVYVNTCQKNGKPVPKPNPVSSNDGSSGSNGGHSGSSGPGGSGNGGR